MNINRGTRPVGTTQKVGTNKRQQESKVAFTVKWNQSSATLGQKVGIEGNINVRLENPSQIKVKILFNNRPYVFADEINVEGSKVTAIWKVKAVTTGSFTSGAYDAEISCDGLSGKTQEPLRIVSAANFSVSRFG
jgi:hypothetical protein